MRPVHLILAASLAANALAVAAFLYTQRKVERVAHASPGDTVLARLALTPAQSNRLVQTQRTLRTELGSLRTETMALFDTALTKVRDAKPGDTSYEAALHATGEVRRRQTSIIARELIAFREQLTPAQREVFNQHIGDWSFIEVMIGLPPDIMRGPPTGPFRAPSPAPLKNGR